MSWIDHNVMVLQIKFEKSLDSDSDMGTKYDRLQVARRETTNKGRVRIPYGSGYGFSLRGSSCTVSGTDVRPILAYFRMEKKRLPGRFWPFSYGKWVQDLLV